MLLVSDAINVAGLGNGAKGLFAEQAIQVQSGRAINQEGHLAGSTQFMDDMVRNLLNWNLATVEDCFKMGSSNPAKLLGLENRIGAIATGYQADIVLWHRPTMTVLATWVNGQLLWCDPKLMGVPATGTGTSNPLQQPQAFSTPTETPTITEQTATKAPSTHNGVNVPVVAPVRLKGSLPKAFSPSQHVGLI
jgi:adenine deaminase